MFECGRAKGREATFAACTEQARSGEDTEACGELHHWQKADQGTGSNAGKVRGERRRAVRVNTTMRASWAAANERVRCRQVLVRTEKMGRSNDGWEGREGGSGGGWKRGGGGSRG
eukprot:6186624-Pleurochrysis_carterae.AAC.2